MKFHIIASLLSNVYSQDCSTAITRLKQGPANYFTIEAGSTDWVDSSFSY